MRKLIQQVKEWAIDKKITGKNGEGTIDGQSKKMIEEANETLAACSRLVGIGRARDFQGNNLIFLEAYTLVEVKDGIGDTLVTLIILAEMLGTNLDECLQMAYDTISKRTGKMVNGTFVKDK
jgi:NTP pyrophosphatase (non-canonical NTP hydrolase)